MNILLVDDENTRKIEELIIRLVGILNHNVTHATSANQAIELLTPDIELAFIDQYMPEKTGLELAEMINEKPEYSHIPLVMLTGYDETAIAVPALTSYGFSYFVSKDHFSGQRIDKILALIETLPAVKTKRQLREAESRINYLKDELNEEMKKRYIADLHGQISSKKDFSTLEKVRSRLDYQEQILGMLVSTPRSFINMYNLAGGIILLESGKKVSTDILNDLVDLPRHRKYNLPFVQNSNSYQTLKGYFKNRENGQFTNVALIVMSLLKNENKWPITVSQAKKRTQRNQTKFYTLIDDIVRELHL